MKIVLGLLLAVSILFFLTCDKPSASGKCKDCVEPAPVEPGVYRVPVNLPTSLEPQRAVLESAVLDAQRRVCAFAKAHGWENMMKESFFDSVEIYDIKDEFDTRVIAHCHEDSATKMPASYCACLERRVLFAMSPGYFKKANPQFVEEKFFEKVLAHEITHRLHVRIVADENAMGPLWFFEGFAIYGAGQLEKNMPSLSSEEIMAIMEDPKRGDYRKYAAVFRHFAAIIPLRTLVKKAHEMDFNEWLRKKEAEKKTF